MPEQFTATFGATFLSMLQIVFIILVAGVCLRKNIITKEHLSGLSTASVDVFLPCMTFTSILFNLKPDEFPLWWVLPLVAVAMSAIGLVIAWLFFFRELPEKMNMLPIGFIQNSGYLVLPVGAVLYKDQFELFSVYVFLYVLGQTPIMWSLGKHMITANPQEKPNWKGLMTPPMVATIVALIFVFSGLRDLMVVTPQERNLFTDLILALLEAIRLIGDATVPTAMFILGGMLAGITFKIRPYLSDTIRILFVKLILIPAVTVAVLACLSVGKANPLMAVFLVIQAAAAPAVSIMLQIERYGGDDRKIGSILLVSYGICMVTLPIWVAVWEMVQ